MKMAQTKIFVVSGGFYYFGVETTAPEGFVALKDAAMFGGFSGGKGLPGVARGDKEAKVTLDRFEEGTECIYPLNSVFAILPCIDLYTFKGTTLR
jgi:hypothetical protein